MRLLLTSTALALALSACAKLSPPRSARPSGGATQATVAPPPATTAEVFPTEPTSDSWKRYYLDQKRFSAKFPGAPCVVETGRKVTYEAHNPAGALFMVVCGASDDPGRIKRAHASVGQSGRIISEGYPDFFGTEAYMAHVRLPDESERVMFFLEYRGRSCTATAEVRSADETTMEFIESFRPEPEGR